ncbi:MAG: sigma factor-like helix-turn-helix DNA-binding protein [Armatimonadota bacterium]
MRRSRQNELERQSDALITASGDGGGRKEYPCHTERWMDILARREQPGAERAEAPGGEIEAKLAGIVVNANLTRRQRMVIRWVARGVSQREIAGMLGLSEAQVSRIRSAALDRIRREGALP